MDVSIDRTSPAAMVVSWTPLSYVEARGFISHYTVAYSSQTSGGRKRQTLATMFQTVPGMNSNTARIEGLDTTDYIVQMSATNGAGTNGLSPLIFVAAPTNQIEGSIYTTVRVWLGSSPIANPALPTKGPTLIREWDFNHVFMTPGAEAGEFSGAMVGLVVVGAVALLVVAGLLLGIILLIMKLRQKR